MKKLIVTYFDASGEDQAHSFAIPVAVVYMFVLTFAVFIAVFLFAVYASVSSKDEAADSYSYYPVYKVEKSELQAYSDKLDTSIAFLQENEIFFRELFNISYIRSHYTYPEFASSVSSTSMLKDLWNIQNNSAYFNIANLMRLTDMANTEIDKRWENHLKMVGHLEEQNVIFEHTPSIWPSTEHTTSRFGFRRSPFTGVPSFHEGADLTARMGTPIKATADGIIVFAGTRTGYGYLVTIDHGFGYMTRYAHNSKLLVKSGDSVKKGDIISLSGSTGRSAGPHLHYEVLYNGTPVNATKFLPPVIPKE